MNITEKIVMLKGYKMIWAICPDCQKGRYVYLDSYTRGKKTGLCLHCFNNRKRNNSNRTWFNNAKKDYARIRMPNHPRANGQGSVKRAVLIMEQNIGRYLLHVEEVHHINGNKVDDRIENLQLVTHKEHIILHHKLRKLAQPPRQNSMCLCHKRLLLGNATITSSHMV